MNRDWLFKYGCLGVAAIYVLLAGSILVRGAEASLQPFGVPEPVLGSPHYADAITWVYVHMTVLGVLIGVVGWFAEGIRLQRAFCATMVAAHLVYLYLDLRTSDTAIGNSLYKGPESAIPAMIGFVLLVVFAGLCLVTFQSSDAHSDS